MQNDDRRDLLIDVQAIDRVRVSFYDSGPMHVMADGLDSARVMAQCMARKGDKIWLRVLGSNRVRIPLYGNTIETLPED